MYTFVRSTKLTNICGRSDYITNKTGKHAEEDVLCIGGATSDWKPYAQYEQSHQRSLEPNNEGRELIVALPNDWDGLLAKPFLINRADKLARKLIGKKTDYQFAVHWNKAHTNLHLHIIFSERSKIPSQTQSKGSTSDFYDRDVYLTQDGKIARKKADRALYDDGTVKPPIHRKGDPKLSEFTAKDKKYKSKSWLQAVKKVVKSQFVLSADKNRITNYLHTYHEGKAPEAAKHVRQINKAIRDTNLKLNDLQKRGYILQKKGNPAYGELYKRIMGQIEDGQSIDNWIYANITLNADKMQKKEDKRYQKEQKAANQILDTAYKLTMQLYESKVSRDISYNNLAYEALREITGLESGTYNAKDYSKLQKNQAKYVELAQKAGKSQELARRMERYFHDKLDFDITKSGSQRSYTSAFDEPYTIANDIIRSIEPNTSVYFAPPSEQQKALDRLRKQQERQRLQGRSLSDLISRAKEKSLEQQSQQHQQNKKRDDWTR